MTKTKVFVKNTPMIKIRLAQTSDISYLRDHLSRHGLESGNHGDFIFAPYEEPWSQSEETLRADKILKWARPVTEVGWERCWIIVDENGIYGEIKLVQQPSIEWIDLYVFAHNQPAIELYSKAGFVKVGRVVDLFRIKGQKIEDIHMTLKLRS